MDIPGRVCDILRPEWKGLLHLAGVSDRAVSRRSGAGTGDWEWMAHLGTAHAGRITAGSHGRDASDEPASALAGRAGWLPGKISHQAASQRESPRQGGVAAPFCLAVWLAGDGASGGARVSQPAG